MLKTYKWIKALIGISKIKDMAYGYSRETLMCIGSQGQGFIKVCNSVTSGVEMNKRMNYSVFIAFVMNVKHEQMMNYTYGELTIKFFWGEGFCYSR